MSAQALGGGAAVAPLSPVSPVSSTATPGAGDAAAGAAFADALTSARQVDTPARDGEADPNAAGVPTPPGAVPDPRASASDESQPSSAVAAVPDPAALPAPALALLLAQSALSSGRVQDVASDSGTDAAATVGAIGGAGRVPRLRPDTAPAGSPGLPAAPAAGPGAGADAALQAPAATVAPDADPAVARNGTGEHTPPTRAVKPEGAWSAALAGTPAAAGASGAPAAPRFGAVVLPAGAASVAARGTGAAQAIDRPGPYVGTAGGTLAADTLRQAALEGNERGDLLAGRFANAMHAESLPAAGLAPLAAAAGPLGGLRDRDAGPSASSDAVLAPGMAGPASSGVSTAQALPAAAPAGAAEFAGALADQISWWLGQKTQGAELTVQGPAGAAVSVSVQVQGNEAHVAFRSEQAQARQLIGDSLAQLEQLLGGSGLVLGQVSVGAGSSGHEGRAAPEADGRVRAPGAAATPVSEAAAPATARALRRGGVDVYA